MNAGTRVIGYVRISRESDTHAGLAAQRATIERECELRGWELVEIVEEIASARTVKKRPLLTQTLQRIERGEATAIVVAKLDRISRSVIDFATLLEQAERRGWKLVILDLGIDLTTPMGAMIAHVLSALSEWERRMISTRTREGLAARKAAGVRIGRPRQLDAGVRTAILDARKDGQSYQEIADRLNEAGVATAQGAPRWTRQVTRKVCISGA